MLFRFVWLRSLRKLAPTQSLQSNGMRVRVRVHTCAHAHAPARTSRVPALDLPHSALRPNNHAFRRCRAPLILAAPRSVMHQANTDLSCTLRAINGKTRYLSRMEDGGKTQHLASDHRGHRAKCGDCIKSLTSSTLLPSSLHLLHYLYYPLPSIFRPP
jgi:hypothetical protein